MKSARLVVLLSFLWASPLLASETPEVAEHDISVTINPEQHILTGSDRMTFASPHAGGGIHFTLHVGLKPLRAVWRGRVLAIRELPAPSRGIARKVLVVLPRGAEVREMTVEYTGKIHDAVRKSKAMGFVRGDDTSGIISPEGVFLHGGTFWYPRGKEIFSRFRIKVRLPESWWDVTEGALVGREVRDGARVSEWKSDVPLDGPVLVANRFKVKGKDFDGVRISAYFLPEDVRLMDDYIESAGRYLAFYRKLLGEYAFSRFDIVENFFTTGYGMPGFTLLGPQVVKMAHFGSKTLGPHSLGHELVHCWWGNHVYTPRGEGNWCEALTTYCANYYWLEKFEGGAKAREYRRRAFLRYSIFVDEKNDYPVREFTYKRKEVDDFVGYTKGSMVMHTLRGLIGKDRFFEGLRRVRKEFGGKVATWDDFRKSFERVSNRDLKWFFDQWIDGKWAPSLSLKDVSVEADGDEWVVKGRIAQTGTSFRLAVPVVLSTDVGRVRKVFELGPDRDRIEFRTKSKPVRLEVDPDFEVFRRFDRSEIHPCLELTLSHDSALVVYPTGGTEAENAFFRGIAQRFGMSARRLPSKADMEVVEEDLKSRSLLVLGGPGINTVAERLAGKLPRNELRMGRDFFSILETRYTHKGQSALVSVRNPANRDRHLTFYIALSPEGMTRARLMSHYGWESYLVYDVRKPRQVLSRGEFQAGKNPCSVELGSRTSDVFSDPAFGPGEAFAFRFEDSRKMSFREMVTALRSYDVVFVGEYHNDWATHHAEYGILAGLSALADRPLVASFEMFERDVQPVLDKYLAGRIDEAEFLRTARPWPNYLFGYRAIVEHARAGSIPVIAANVPRRLASAIARKGKKGLEDLSEEDRKFAARELKTPEGPYKEKFLRVMLGGRGRANPMAERFYLSQSLKDDTMAESIADFLRKPGRGKTLVVHYNGAFHSDGHLGTAGKFEALMPERKVAVVKIISDRDPLSADVDAFRKEADFLLVCRKRGEDNRDGTHSFQISRRLRFVPLLPRPFDPARTYPAVVAFHGAGESPKALLDTLRAWGLGEAILILPQGTEPVWNSDGTPGYAWFSSEERAESARILATFGAELAGYLFDSYKVDEERFWFLGFGEGAEAAAFCASGLPRGRVRRIVAVGASRPPVVSSLEGPAEVVFLNPRAMLGPRGNLPAKPGINVTTRRVELGVSIHTDGLGKALAKELGFGGPANPALDRDRTLVLSLENPSPHARRWAYKIQKSLEKSLKAEVVLHTGPGGKVTLADVCLALHLKGVNRVVHQPLAFEGEEVPRPEFPEWAREEMEAKVEHLPPLTLREVLRVGVFPPKPRSSMAPSFRFVILVGPGDAKAGAGEITALVERGGLSGVRVVDVQKGLGALRNALRSSAPRGGMPGMMGRAPVTYVLRPSFAAREPAGFLPAVYRHGDRNLHIRAGLGCLNLANAILKRLE